MTCRIRQVAADHLSPDGPELTFDCPKNPNIPENIQTSGLYGKQVLLTIVNYISSQIEGAWRCFAILCFAETRAHYLTSDVGFYIELANFVPGVYLAHE